MPKNEHNHLNEKHAQLLAKLLPGISVAADQVQEWASLEEYLGYWSAYGFQAQPAITQRNPPFDVTTFSLNEGPLSMFAVATSQVFMSSPDSPKSATAALVLPIHMRYHYQTSAGHFNQSGHNYAVYVRAEEAFSGVEEGAYLNLPLDEHHLLATLTAMLGGQGERAAALVNTSRLVPTRQAGVDYLHVARQLWAVSQQLTGYGDMIKTLGLDEAFYRMAARMLIGADPLSHVPTLQSANPVKKRQLDATCEWIMAHLHQVITLTQLETISGLSARSLQTAFANHLKTTPMGWVRQQRLARARHCLLTDRYTTLEQLAHDCGYANKSLFYTQYKARYGCTPGATARSNRHKTRWSPGGHE